MFSDSKPVAHFALSIHCLACFPLHLDAPDTTLLVGLANELQVVRLNPHQTLHRWALHSIPLHVALSPRSRPDKSLLGAVSFEDGSVCVFGPDSIKELEAGTRKKIVGWTNALAFDHSSGTHLASVGDDQMCRIWEIDPATTSAQDPVKIPLKDKGIAVEWHRNLASYILIGLQNGLVHLFNVETLSLEVEVLVPGSRPLAGLSWHPDSPNMYEQWC
ncbi:Nucleoporin Nup37 [Kappamyces sp. JEL0829]|nr:Nucleoporin Nup37 [Kappamyces sp. JEL0829]